MIHAVLKALPLGIRFGRVPQLAIVIDNLLVPADDEGVELRHDPPYAAVCAGTPAIENFEGKLCKEERSKPPLLLAADARYRRARGRSVL